MRIFRRRKPRRDTVQCVDCGTWLADTLKTFPEFDHQPLCFHCLLLRRAPRTPPWMKYEDNGSGLTTTPRYYAKVGDQLTGPHPSYTEARRDLADTYRRHCPTDVSRAAVLLDLGSITVGDGQFGTLLQSDPVLRAVFELGRQHERMAADLR